MCRRLKFPPVVLILGWILLVHVQYLRLFRLMLPLLKQYVYDFAPGEVPPSRFTNHEIVKKFKTTGPVENKKVNRKHTVLTEETLDAMGASLERTPKKSIPKLAQ